MIGIGGQRNSADVIDDAGRRESTGKDQHIVKGGRRAEIGQRRSEGEGGVLAATRIMAQADRPAVDVRSVLAVECDGDQRLGYQGSRCLQDEQVGCSGRLGSDGEQSDDQCRNQ